MAQDCGSLYITALAGLSRYKQNWSAEIGYPAIAVIAHGVHDETDVEHPLGDVFPDAQGGQLVRGEAPLLGAAGYSSGANFGADKVIRMMQREVPPAFATLGESAEDDALVVNVEALLHRGNGFENIHFASPMPAGAGRPSMGRRAPS